MYCLIPFILFSEDVTVTAQIDGVNYPGLPMHGTITITHNKEAEVNLTSFQLEGKPLKTTFQKDIVLSSSSPMIFSVYEFEIPGEKKGLHFLPEVSVNVGGKVYVSTPSTYEVSDKKIAPQTTSGQVVLGLEPFIEGSQTLYPGQRSRVGYRYIYNQNFSLTKEEVPLLDAKGFRKIGDKTVKESTRDDLTTLEIYQIIEAIKPGTYTFSPSVIQGKVYTVDALGKKHYSKTEYTANAPSVTIQVDPFPERSKPSTFNGAIGDYKMELTLLTPSEVTVGDKMQLQITISGTGEIENIPMPDICCQPGFSGFFKQSDLPPTEKVEGSQKTFIVEMRPLSSSIKEIPSLAFSFFNPSTVTYETVKTKPIPLKVLPQKEESPAQQSQSTIPKEEPSSTSPAAIEIENNFQLSSTDLSNTLFGTWWVMMIMPIGALILFLQYNLRNTIQEQKAVVQSKNSIELFKEALRKDPGSSEFYNELHNAFVLRLFERGEVKQSIMTTDELPNGEVRAFLSKIEEIRFSGKTGETLKMIIREALALFAKLEGEK
jgi:hypothetical protein